MRASSRHRYDPQPPPPRQHRRACDDPQRLRGAAAVDAVAAVVGQAGNVGGVRCKPNGAHQPYRRPPHSVPCLLVWVSEVAGTASGRGELSRRESARDTQQSARAAERPEAKPRSKRHHHKAQGTTARDLPTRKTGRGGRPRSHADRRTQRGPTDAAKEQPCGPQT